MPKVSICVPTYNRAHTLRTTLEAILRQTYADWELIVCDDASTDDTESVVNEYQDGRIRYYRNQANKGLYANFNYGISLARGEYVAIYHDHDIYLPNIIERSVELLERYPSASFVHTGLLLIDDGNHPVGVDVRPFPELLAGSDARKLMSDRWHSPVMAATAMVRRSAYECVGPYRFDEFGLGCDLHMWFELCAIGDIAYVRDPQALIRVRQKGQATATFRWEQVKKSIRMHRDHLDSQYSTLSVSRLRRQLRFVLERDVKLASYGLRAVLLEPEDTVREGQQVLKEEASIGVQLLVELTRCSKIAQQLLARVMLQRHYQNVAQDYESQLRSTADYLRHHPSLAEFVTALAN